MKVSKSYQIRELAKANVDFTVIAETVGCSRDYVRVVARQRAEGLASKADKKYREKQAAAFAALSEEAKEAARSQQGKRLSVLREADPTKYQRRLAQMRKRYHERYRTDHEFREKCLRERKERYRRKKAEAAAAAQQAVTERNELTPT